MWKEFDNFVQNWYMSMSWPLRDFVMVVIGLVTGVIIIGVVLCIT